MQSILITFKYFPAPHTSNAICELMMDVLEQWNISGKMLAITSDNGSNVIKGLKLLGKKINEQHGNDVVEDPGWIIRCLAHTIQLGVKQALKILSPELTKIRCLVMRCRKGIYRQMFDQKKVELGFEVASQVPRYDTDTRWGSTYELCISAHNLRAVFNALVNNLHLGLQDLKLDDYEWAKVFSVATFLQKAHEVTVLQSSKTRVTLSLIPGMYTLLKNHCDAVKLGQMPDWTSNECKEAATCMLEKLQSYDDLINSNIVKMAKLLDPRFKSDTRLMPTLRTILIDNYEYGQLDSDARPQSNTQYESSVLDAVFDLDRDDTESRNVSQIGVYDADEVTKYFQFTSIPDTSTGPLDWRKAAEHLFQQL